MGCRCDSSLSMQMNCWLVYGRAHATESNPEPQIICTKVYGPNEVFAKSQFWKINKEQHKLKRASGEVLRCTQVHERNTKSVSNYGIWFHYRDRTAFRNAYKEYRATSLNMALTMCMNEMAGRQKVKRESIQIVKCEIMGNKDIRTRNPRCGRFSNSCGIKFPLWKEKVRHSDRGHNNKITASRPVTFKSGKSVNA